MRRCSKSPLIRQNWGHLQSQQWLLLVLGGCGRLGLGSVNNGFSLGSFGEVGGLELRRADWLDLDCWSWGLDGLWGCRAAVANILVSLGAVVIGILLHQSGGTGSLLVGEFLGMVGLGVDKLLNLGNLLIDKFAIADVDQRSKVSDGCTDQGEAPDRDNLDEPVGKEGSNESLFCQLFHSLFSNFRREGTYSSSVQDVFGEQNALELNKEEVCELLQIFQNSLDSFFGQGVVFARTERTCQALVENELAGSFSSGGDYEIQISMAITRTF